jgi:hypothetical protein
MNIYGMDDFQSLIRRKLKEWYKLRKKVELNDSQIYVVWSCKTLQNYKALVSTSMNGDGIYAEYTYNGDKGELYEDIYMKLENTCHEYREDD